MPYPTYSVSSTRPPLASPRSFDSLDKKHLIFETVKPISSFEELRCQEQQVNDPNWRPGFRARFPWIGFGALFTVLLCAASSCVILLCANGKSQTQWPEKIAPNVLLSIMNSTANICFGIAIGNGIAIAWWRKTLKGSSIVELHRSWAFSTSIKDIFLSLKYFNIVALAALTAKLTLIDGTLMQKALTFYDAVDTASINVTDITGFAGRHWAYSGTVDDNGQAAMMENSMLDTLKIWTQTGGFYPLQWDGCQKGFCYIEVHAVGFGFDCDPPTQQDINYGQLLESTPHDASVTDVAPLFEIHFDSVDFNPYRKNSGDVNYEPPPVRSRSGHGLVTSAGKTSHLKMHVLYTQAGPEQPLPGQSHCPGTRFEQSCRLWPAIVKYPVQIQNIPGAKTVSIGAYTPSLHESITTDSDTSPYSLDFEQQNGFEVIEYLAIKDTLDNMKGAQSTHLSGIQMAFEMALQGKAHLSPSDKHPGSFQIHQHGQAGNYLPEPPFNTSTCSYHYVNPMKYYKAPNGFFTIPSVIAKVNQIVFGYATDISRDGLSVLVPHHKNTKVDGFRFPYTVHYRADFDYMWGAVSATIVCVLLVLPVYWGFWELGRKVSLNPFEIAHAFRSPVVGYASTAVTEDLMKEVGNQHIRYGPVLSGEGFGRFGVAAPEYVARVPTGGSTFRDSSSRRRLWGD